MSKQSKLNLFAQRPRPFKYRQTVIYSSRCAEAVAHLREALQLQPDYPQAKQQLAELSVQKIPTGK